MPNSPEPLRVSIDPGLPEHHARGIWRALNQAPEAVGRPRAEDRPESRRFGHALALLGLCGVGVLEWLFWDTAQTIGAAVGFGLVLLHLRHRHRRKADEAEASIDPRVTIAFFEGSFVVDTMLDDVDRARLGRIQRVSEVLLEQGHDLRWVAEREWGLAVRLPALTLDRVRAEGCSHEGERERRKAETSTHEAFVDGWIRYLEDAAGVRPGPGRPG
ncbi:hypothetical protein [Nocardiopsis listeri]|uniref:hypothetical protein n=1 Tax=Nocardiopsis listeri TaxID=53440 RepID=UPI000AA98679|nr:hypothetical protein [Nocardiopsis listeri]